MRNYPLRAKVLLISEWTIATVAVIQTLYGPPIVPGKWSTLGVAVAAILALAAGAQKVAVVRSQNSSEDINISLGFLVTFTTMLLFGQRAAVLTGLLSGLAATMFPKRQPFYQLSFNLCVIVVSAWTSSLVYKAMGGYSSTSHIIALTALLLAATTYFFFNTLPVSAIVSAFSGQRTIALWKKDILWSLLSYLAGACCAGLAQMLVTSDIVMLVLAMPILAFILQSYKVYSDRSNQKETYIQELQKGQQSLEDLYQSTIRSLAAAIAMKDRSTHTHLHRVQRYATAIASAMNVTGHDMEAVRTGALLHDIGKLGVPDYILLKTGPLTAEEFSRMKRHTLIGVSILEPVKFPWPVIDVVRYHHERWDGKGYPDGLANVAIPLCARIMAVADVYDALTSDRPYRMAWTQEQALAYVREGSGTAFDPAAVSALEKVLAMEAAGQLPLPPAEAPRRDISNPLFRTISEEWMLYQTTNIINSSQSLGEQLILLSERLTSIMPDTHCLFAIADNDLGEGSEGACNFKHVGPSEGLPFAAALVLDECSPVITAIKTAKLLHSVAPFDNVYYSTITAPLLHEGRVVGAMTVIHPSMAAFTSDDETLIVTIASLVETAVHREITNLRIRSEAFIDPLTGLFNGRYLKDPLGITLNGGDKTGGIFAVLFLDMDNFKQVNDTYGHQQGDRVLAEIARLLHEVVRVKDTVVRLHGDEFLVVLPDTGTTEAYEVANRVRRVLGSVPVLLSDDIGGSSGAALHMHLSIGIACAPDDGLDLDTLSVVADKRMYDAKRLTHSAAITAPSHTAQIVG